MTVATLFFVLINVFVLDFRRNGATDKIDGEQRLIHWCIRFSLQMN